ncbi:PREDICTED: uncharacterized protein LOC105563914 [Vollenhovia emeryi]|uniref:uncharacterized protein LOC105563914 n=1 Tax=Vollenhovia emeryi TaxID=411798 RepID=UPI0005F40DC7|nr:PREDICTED: uncharacterized protein LOC105563914 [Vollenhovia emeryi]
MTVINMYEKITSCLLILLVIARAKEATTAKNVKTADFSNLRLSTVLPYSLLYNDEHLTKENPKRSLVLLMPLSQTQTEHEKPRETIQKTKRCGTQHKKNRFLLLSRKEDDDKIRNTDENIVGIPKQISDKFAVKNAKSSATSKKITEIHEDEVLLRALKDNLNTDDVIVKLRSREKGKKCNSDKYICHCKEEKCLSSSSRKSPSRMLGSSRKDKPERTNNRKLTKPENAKSDILQQKSPILYESPHELSFPDLLNYFPIQPYQERMNIPSVPVLYQLIPNVLPRMVGNEGKYINIGIPFTSSEGRPNYPVGNNQNHAITYQKPFISSPITERYQAESSTSVTSPSTNNVDATTVRETTGDLETSNLIGQVEDQEQFPKLTTEALNVDAADSKTEANLPLNYSTDVTKENNTISSFDLNEVTPQSEDFIEKTEQKPDNNLSKSTYSTDYARTVPSFISDGTYNGKLINMKECIQLFGRDVCVLSAASPKMLAKQAQANNINEYSTIRIPEYVTQMSARKKTTLNNIDYSDKLKTTDPYSASDSSTNGINKSNVNLNKFLESTSVKSIKQISEPDVDYDKSKSFNAVKNMHTPIKKLMDPAIDEPAKTKKDKLLGKSKSRTNKLLLNPNEKITNTTSSDKVISSTPSYKSTVISCDSKTEYDSKEQDRNNLKESNTVSEKNIPQEHFKEKTATTSSNSKTGSNFEEETKKEITGTKASVHPKEVPQEQFTTMQYFDDSNILGALIDSSTSRLPFWDNLLLNSIRKVINDFATDPRLTKTKNFNENILQTQGKALSPEILQVPNLKNILSIPQIENTIVEKAKDVLSYVTAIPRRHFTNNWSHGVIRNTLHSILNAVSGLHHKLPPMTLEEHQFKDGQWRTELVTLAPISNHKFSKGTPENLRQSIKDLLSSPAIRSQTDRYVVRNMIVQSVKNNLTNDNKDDKIDDSIISALNDVLQGLKNSNDINALENSNEVVDDKQGIDMAFSQEISTSNYEELNVDNSISNNKQNVDIKKDKTDTKKMDIIDNQKAKTLEDNTNMYILTTTEFPHLLQLQSEKEEETTNNAKIKENTTDFGQIKKMNVQDDTEKELVEPQRPKIIYHKAISQSNPNVLATLEPDSTGTEQYLKNHHIDEESAKDTTTITNAVQESSPNYAQVSDGIILENLAKTKDTGEEVKHILNEKTTTSTEIDPLIILERIKSNSPPTRYYSPEILKYATKNRVDDKNVETTTASTSFIRETSPNYGQKSDCTILQIIAKANDEIKYPSTTTFGNLISSTNVEYRDYNPKISLTGKNLSESQQNSQRNFTGDNIVKIHEVTTEIERTYAKTTYFKAESPGGSARISSPSLTSETTCTDTNSNLISNGINNTDNAIKAKEVIVSSSKSSVRDDIDPSQLSPSSIALDDISELQGSQLYYINDGVKLPLEIKRLEDGSYALSIAKKICEQILTRKCPCCVPLQGYVVRSIKNHQPKDIHAITTEKQDQENMYVNNINRDYQSVEPFNTLVTSLITRRDALRTQKSKEEEEEEEERINVHHPLMENDDNLVTNPMPVIDFAKKYNLLLDFNEEKIPFNGIGLQDKLQNYDKSLIKSEKMSEYDQSEEKNLNNYPDMKNSILLDVNSDAINKFQDLTNVRKKKNTPNMNLLPILPIAQQLFNLRKNSEERKARAEVTQSEIGQGSKLREAKTANDVENAANAAQKTNSEGRETTNPAFKEINISESSKEEINWDKLSDIVNHNNFILEHVKGVFRKEKNKEHVATELIDNRSNEEIKNFKENIGKYRYQRNTNNEANKGTELVKSMLYWLKGLFVN